MERSTMYLSANIPAWVDCFTKEHFPEKDVSITLDTEDAKWTALLHEFFNFLNASGYIIDATAIPEMVEACEEIHINKWYERNNQFKHKEVNDACI